MTWAIWIDLVKQVRLDSLVWFCKHGIWPIGLHQCVDSIYIIKFNAYVDDPIWSLYTRL
jgi:hypothetical protein